MALDDVLAQFSKFLEGDKITGRQAGLIIFVWMGAVALFGLISYIIVFMIIGF
ncbi:hypothetical protein [Natrinema salaciae]|uniref:Uncharacterized protein n=1 Tax=Natrinema salaciae TaxID=1186196 RepID=A0A1H9P5M4_9EURY|nr:hypothetical protein [Natrinema salaciae]SER43546.1 hypothetical protein SAMN04489841_3870 [Natrinema salaciae]